MRKFLLLAFLAAASQPVFAQSADSARQAAERDLLKRTVEIPTVQFRGQMPRLVKLLSAEFRKAGISDITVKDHEGRPGDKTQTLVARWHAASPSGQRPIVLMAHMDVVEAKAADWKNDPFIFREQDGHYLGRGVADNKSGVAAIVAALQRLKASGFQPTRDIIVLFTGDEENAGNGVRLAATDWGLLKGAEYALNLDDGGCAIYKDGRAEGCYVQVAEKTYADFTFSATNRGGHSSAPRPDNAIYQLAAALKALEEYRFTPMLSDANRGEYLHTVKNDRGAYGSIVQAWLDDPTNMEKADAVEAVNPGHTRTRCIATQLSGGHAPNALPQKAEANVNCRIFPGVDPAIVMKELQGIAGKEVTVTRADVGSWAPPSPPREDISAAFTKAVHAKFPDAPIIPAMSAGATDGVFTRANGIPTYGVAGFWGVIGNELGVHGLDERLPVKSFHDGVDVLESMLRDLAGR
jgi:acetylornithine deacetylase/succinyl-diaminopimelate desuccinylase-like protein